jgi:hypothetical protein
VYTQQISEMVNELKRRYRLDVERAGVKYRSPKAQPPVQLVLFG